MARGIWALDVGLRGVDMVRFLRGRAWLTGRRVPAAPYGSVSSRFGNGMGWAGLFFLST
jgi:hypothetical protein